MTTPFKLEITREQARKLRKILSWCDEHFPLGVADEMTDISDKLRTIVFHGCEVHGTLCRGFKTEKHTTEWVCMKCNPEKCAVYETKYKGIT